MVLEVDAAAFACFLGFEVLLLLFFEGEPALAASVCAEATCGENQAQAIASTQAAATLPVTVFTQAFGSNGYSSRIPRN